MFTVDDCKVIQVPIVPEPRGNLSFVEENRHIPFPIRRLYWLYDVPGGAERGSHAHKKLYQFIIAASGSFRVVLDDGKEKRSFFLNRSYQGLLVPPGLWRDLEDFSSGAVCMVLASEYYDEDDYIRDYQEFLEFRKTSSR